ncbi:dienelactone hydrolase family protein [Archangium primigenium]|nr:dienelactone hydrolase family protein [Archangium primigenium]
MPTMSSWLTRVSLVAALSACSAAAPPRETVSAAPLDELAIEAPVASRAFVSFPAVGSPTPLQVAGLLSVPQGLSGRMPAVVIAHGSGGVDTRGAFYARALHEAGIATLEIDMWAARGLTGGAEGRPQAVSETLPDAYGALKYLSAHPAIDASRIGIMGFSWGGVMSMLTATRENEARAESGQRFVAHAPLYPVCWVYNRVPGYGFSNLTGAPVFIQAGTADAYDAPDSCRTLIDSLGRSDNAHVSLAVYPGATHGWDRLQPAARITDPYSHRGEGGEVDLVPSPESALESRKALVLFFQRAFELIP